MRTIRNFLLRCCYYLAMAVGIVYVIAILTDEAVHTVWKVAAVVALLVLWSIPERFPAVFHKEIRSPKRMSGLEFERYCAILLRKKDFRKIAVTSPTGDFGADIVAYDRCGAKWVFQCKLYTGNVGNAAVQQAVAAKAHYGADKAAVMTNARLTKQARQLAEENRVALFEQIFG